MPGAYRTKRRSATKIQSRYRGWRQRRGHVPMYKRRQFRRKNLYLNNSVSISVGLRETGIIQMDNSFQTSGITFKLNDFNAYGKFTALFEMFRIKKIIQRIYPTADSFIAPLKVSIAGQDDDEHITQVGCPLLLHKRDVDDVETATNIDDCLKNPAYKVQSLKKPCKIEFTPNTLIKVYEGTVTNNYKISYGDWLNCENSSDNEYYGLVRCIHCQGCSSTYPMTFRVITTAVVEFKGLRLDET